MFGDVVVSIKKMNTWYILLQYGRFVFVFITFLCSNFPHFGCTLNLTLMAQLLNSFFSFLVFSKQVNIA